MLEVSELLEKIRPKGYWIPIPYELDYGSDAKCSECGREVIAGGDYKFCPYCGAEMESEE